MTADVFEEFVARFRRDLAQDVAVALAETLPAQTRLLSFEQVADALGLKSRRAVQDIVTAGKLQALKVGAADGRTMIEQQELDRYIAAQRLASRSVT